MKEFSQGLIRVWVGLVQEALLFKVGVVFSYMKLSWGPRADGNAESATECSKVGHLLQGCQGVLPTWQLSPPKHSWC